MRKENGTTPSHIREEVSQLLFKYKAPSQCTWVLLSTAVYLKGLILAIVGPGGLDSGHRQNDLDPREIDWHPHPWRPTAGLWYFLL